MAIDMSKSFLLGNQVCATAINCFVMANKRNNPARFASEYALRSFADERRHDIGGKAVGPRLVRGVKKGGFVCSSSVACLAERQ